eukprot:TRINITY_DN1896_c0_g1_i6.p1 TRINITY_DN1896_c0_g1~~TRINITY_DN1896_c0_g1_i6.p1  ORF type:complete len:800 (+),score=283.28 TRINITY_DN1896_c0_g1_i6:30-2429(+)
MSQVPRAAANVNSVRIPPFHYIHVLDKNTNVTRLEVGPLTFVRKEEESIVTGEKPLKMIVLPPRHYCEITDPVVRDEKSNVQFDKYGQAVIQYGEVEYRFSENYKEPFPLYPAERLTKNPTQLTVVKENVALKIEAVRNFVDKSKKSITAGDRWLFAGPATYYPRVEERIVETVLAQAIPEHNALKLRALQEFTDRTGVLRKTGEEWLVRQSGSYLPDVYEDVIGIIKPEVITDRQAIQLRANQNFTDVYGRERKAGEEWLITLEDTSLHLVDVYEEFVKYVDIVILGKDEYCTVLDPLDPKTNKNRLGSKQMICGETSFFLKPGEALEAGIQKIYVLPEDEALLLRAKEHFIDAKKEEHQPGDRWMVYGPTRFIPPVEVEVLELRRRIPLDKNEGIYVRDTRSGAVRPIVAEAYMLKPHEELWEMEVNEMVEELLKKSSDSRGSRDKTRVIFHRIPFNHAVQVYDYTKRESRVVFGPERVMLGPDEQFTVTVLSGSKPKRPGVIQTIDINLGPDFSTDVVIVETLDHARLRLQLSYNWHFRIDKTSQEDSSKIFNVRDFIGDMCNLMASKVRSAVAAVTFEMFHKSSAKIIRKAIFGVDSAGKILDEFLFPKNSLVITNVDIQNVEPVDEKTQRSLQNSVQQAIERTTKNQEDKARRQAEKMEQEAKGQLDKQAIEDQAKAEIARTKLLQLQAESKGVQNQGKAIAEAKARAEAEEITANSKVKMAELKASADKVEYETKLETTKKKQNGDIEYQKKIAELEISRSKSCLLYTSDAADDLLCVDLGGRRIIKKKKSKI